MIGVTIRSSLLGLWSLGRPRVMIGLRARLHKSTALSAILRKLSESHTLISWSTDSPLIAVTHSLVRARPCQSRRQYAVRPTDMDFATVDQLTHGSPRFTALRFRSVSRYTCRLPTRRFLAGPRSSTSPCCPPCRAAHSFRTGVKHSAATNSSSDRLLLCSSSSTTRAWRNRANVSAESSNRTTLTRA
jgi:hypothetical protein